jgi:Endoglucanase
MKLGNKTMALLLALLLAVSTAGTAASAKGSKPKPGAKPVPLQQYVEAMQPGWNLGNTFDAVGMGGSSDPSSEDETAWGNPLVTKELIHQIKKQGFKSIRIPVTWDVKMGAAPDYAIDPAFMDRIEEVVDWSLDEGLYVMINLHHDSWRWVNGMGSNYDEVLARYNAAWEQIADRFKNHSRKLMFESINEPQFYSEDAGSYQQLLDTLNLSFRDIVRTSGGENGTRPIVLPTMHTSSDQHHLDALKSSIIGLNDPNIIVTTHYYGFWPFSVNIAGFTKFDETTRNDIVQTYDRLYNTFVAEGIPVVVGEFGLLGFDQHTGTIEQGEKLKFFEYMITYAESKGITHMLWDNGQHFNRHTYQWNDPQLFEMMKASWSGRSATADTDLIFVKRGEPVQDAVVPLHLNGNKLKKVTLNGKSLKKGKDYSVAGDAITFNAALLQRLTASGATGERAKLTTEFNKGADWTFRVISYENPVLGGSAGTAASFAIPASFNGDLLATMEAYYEDGSNAGPQNWTPFKEFAYTFEPSYSTNEIILKQNFFNEVRDGKVILKFHFWSGTVVEYTVTKQGSVVTGTAVSP